MSFLILLLVVGIWAGGLAGIFAVVVAFGSILLHELGHAVVARHLGVQVVGIELYFFGGAAKMVGQPKRAGDEIAIAAAGPAVSFALAGVGTLMAAATGFWFFELFAWINLFVGAFNLIPALPMDGGRILRAALSRKLGYRRATELSITIARGFALFFGLVGLFTLQFQLILLAGVLWFLGTAELNAARQFGLDYGDTVSPFGVHRPERQAQEQTDVMPQGFKFGSWGAVHKPRATGGFVIRQRGGRFVIEPL